MERHSKISILVKHFRDYFRSVVSRTLRRKYDIEDKSQEIPVASRNRSRALKQQRIIEHELQFKDVHYMELDNRAFCDAILHYCKGKEVSYNVLFGEDITLHNITSELDNTKTSKIQWKKNGHQLQECGTLGRQSGGTSSTPSLTIRKIEICDLGTYTSCLDNDPTRCTHHDIGVVVFRGASGGLEGQNNIFDLWSSNHTANTNDTNAMRIGSMSGLHYKSEMVEKWSDLKVQKVKLAVHQGGVEKAFFIFDAKETDKMSWMKKGRLISTSYDDNDALIDDGGINRYFSMTGLDYSYVRRRFFLNKRKNNCDDMEGWLSLTELGHCGWEKQQKYPGIYFSPTKTRTNWNHAEKADELTISLVLNISEITPCHCPCSDLRRQTDKFWASLYGYSKSELEQILEPILLNIKDDLKLNKTKLSSYKRKRNSAQDNRKSSEQIGIMGVIFIGVVLSLVIFIDIVEIRRRLADINISI
ncbi:unnamed protein product [Mytilus coruscus]|uniref:Uncharacterized protein n=1 Tax=Mytilus coruscus TaxID=42192 RepID=A0A6J8AYD0_MYTCO|nr:unnamed protein product [Mytilus coruscus]